MKKLRLSSNERNDILRHIEEQLIALNRYDDISTIKTVSLINEKEIEKPLLLITSDTYLKMFSLVHSTNQEIEWHMLCRRNKEENIYVVYDVLVFPQEATAASVTADQEKYSQWMLEHISNPEFPIEDLRGHGHSHVNMSVFSSATDDQYQKDLVTKVEDGDYYIFLILNKKFEMDAYIYDFNQNIMFENGDIEIRTVTTDNENIGAWAKKEIETYVTTRYCPQKPKNKTKNKSKTKASPTFYEEEDDYFGNYYYGGGYGFK